MANITNGETTKNYGLANLVYENADRGTEKNKKGIQNTKKIFIRN